MTHTLIFDIGKTNKKCFLFDETFQMIHQEYVRFEEILDDDGFPCDDLAAISKWILEVFERLMKDKNFDVRAVNFSTYGASFVHLDEPRNVLTPLYNYLKPYPEALSEKFYKKHGDELEIATATGSPNSGMLNAGFQLYWLKQKRIEIFQQIKYTIHFPQYLSFLFSEIAASEFTSIGCHTSLWDYEKENYHEWVIAEGIEKKLPPIHLANAVIEKDFFGKKIRIGAGIHDSSAALLPYLIVNKKPFLLISTGTWSIALNPFFEGYLTKKDLERNCLNYMRIDGKAVKASRLFLGNEHHLQVEKLKAHFGKNNCVEKVAFNEELCKSLQQNFQKRFYFESLQLKTQELEQTEYAAFENYETAYHQLLLELVEVQIEYAEFAIGDTSIETIYIDGGFVENEIFTRLLARHFKTCKVFTAQMPLGSALGAALILAKENVSAGFLQKHFEMRLVSS